MIETEKGRREFLKGTAWMGLAAVAAGCMPETFEPGKIDLRNIGNAGEQYRT